MSLLGNLTCTEENRMSKIVKVLGREIIDSRGNPTVE
ncbi:hypothetical protein QMN29_25685, partial [Escherichia coli]